MSLASSPSRNNPDDLSLLTDQSNASTASRIFNNVTTVFSKAGMILRGENPDPIPEDESIQVPGIKEVPTEISATDRTNGLDRPSLQRGQTYGDFLADDPSEMTVGRRIALHLMKNHGWYNPRLNQVDEFDESETPEDSSRLGNTVNDSQRHLQHQAYPFTHSRRENPSLAKAWAYFEHVSLSRYIVPEGELNKPKKSLPSRIVRRLFCKGDQQLAKAEPGEPHLSTRLYKPIFTPHKQLGDFGLGIGLYFSTLRALTILTFLAGAVNTSNIRYFASSDYNSNPRQQDVLENFGVVGSAICVDTSWVHCAECSTDMNFTRGDFFPKSRFELVNSTSGAEFPFVKKNNCDGATYEQGFVNYGTVFLMIGGIFLLNIYLQRMEVAFDEDEQTAQDYAVLIDNPPGDATDPKEWHEFFKRSFGAHATTCTIAVDNDLLVKALVERRELLRKIEMMIDPGTSMDTLTLAGIAAKEERERKFFGHLKAILVPGVSELFARVVVLNAMVQGLAQQDYPATKVFLAFETEAAQRHILSSLNYGSLDVRKNRVEKADDPAHLFRGKLLLAASEPDEPNTVRWQDLNEKTKDRLRQQATTIFVTVCAVFAIAIVVYITNRRSPFFAAIVISLFNSIFPMFAKMMTNTESHASEGGKQRSLYFKIALFRWINTAVVFTIITPFTSTLQSRDDSGEEGGLIEKVYALFFSEIVITNAIQLADPVGHLQRHFLAPRATTQDAMNINMRGQAFELAERYTNMTKILFLALWYSAIFPGALYLCAFALFINYFSDRFSLMRTWKRAPQLGTQISEFSRHYFFSVAIAAMIMMSSYYWSAFPFDNLCITDSTVDASIAGSYEFRNETEVLRVGDPIYKPCRQDFFRYRWDELSFPFIASNQPEDAEWMTDDQQLLSDVFGWTAVGVIGFVFLSFVGRWLMGLCSSFRGTYDACGEDQNINFSDVPSINTYVPQVQSEVYSYPLLACHVDDIDKDLLDWTDPDHPDFVFYDLTRDADVLLRGMDVSAKTVFSQIQYFPPPNRAPTNGHR